MVSIAANQKKATADTPAEQKTEYLNESSIAATETDNSPDIFSIRQQVKDQLINSTPAALTEACDLIAGTGWQSRLIRLDDISRLAVNAYRQLLVRHGGTEEGIWQGLSKDTHWGHRFVHILSSARTGAASDDVRVTAVCTPVYQHRRYCGTQSGGIQGQWNPPGDRYRC